MPPPNNPNVAKVALVFTHDVRTFVNTYHVASPSEITSGDLTNIAQAFEAWWTATGNDRVTVATALRQIQVRKLDPSDPLALDYGIDPPIAGQFGGEPLPGNVSVTQSWRSGLAGKKYRGRTYVPGLGEGQVDATDRIGSADVVGLGNAAMQLIIDIAALGLGLVIFHRADNSITPIISVIIEALVDSQRRRLPARGR